MIKVKAWVPKLILTGCVLLVVFLSSYAVNSQQKTSNELRPDAIALTKQDLVKTVLSESGTAKRYDLHLGNSVDIMVSWNNPKFRTWLHQIFTEAAGWKSVEAKYETRLETDFSEAELQELASLFRKPVMQKLLQAEAQGYTDSATVRRERFQQVWEDYQSGKINPPQEVLK